MSVYCERIIERDGHCSLHLEKGVLREYWKGVDIVVARNVGEVDIHIEGEYMGKYIGCFYDEGWVHKVRRYRILYMDSGWIYVDARVSGT